MRFLTNIALAALSVFFLVDPALAAEGAAAATSPWTAVAGGVAIAIAAFGGTLSQGKLVATALDGIARNPGAGSQMQTPMVLGLAFVESLVIFALVVSMRLVGLF